MLETILSKYELLLYVYIRMLGMIVFNPVFGRRNIPALVKSALALVISIVVVIPMSMELVPETGNLFMFSVMLLKEFVCGYLLGLILNMFFGVVSVSGEIMDMQMGLGMSKVYDPGSNIQMPLMGSFLNVILVLIFFLTNSHLTFIRICVLSYNVLPIEHYSFNSEIAVYLIQLFSYVITLSMKMAFPIIAAELVTEAGIGIIMRAVPQINVFVVGVQLKVLIAILVMMGAAPVAVYFFDGMLGELSLYLTDALIILSGA